MDAYRQSLKLQICAVKMLAIEDLFDLLDYEYKRTTMIVVILQCYSPSSHTLNQKSTRYLEQNMGLAIALI